MQTETRKLRGVIDTYGSGESHPPALYHTELCASFCPDLASIGTKERAFFSDHGYLALQRVFPPTMIEAAKEGMLSLLRGENEAYEGIHYEQAFTPEQIAQMSDEALLDTVRKFWDFVGYEPRLSALAEDAAVLETVSSLMGGAEPELFQNSALIKPPRTGREKPWHQDLAYFAMPPDTPVVALWLALDEATLANGCMRILDGAHHKPILHFKRRDWQICDTFFHDGSSNAHQMVAAPLPPGGGLFFSGLLPHGTPTNLSPNRRRAVQFWWRPKDTPAIPQEERLAIWGEDGKDVTC